MLVMQVLAGAEPLPAGEERVFPRPVGTDLQDPLAGAG